jgi:glycosyltransferase involved in cell wall biosynthesis
MCAHAALIADGLAVTEDVHAWLANGTELKTSEAVTTHNTLGRLSVRDLVRTGRLLNRFQQPRRLLIYWVPHAFGYKSMNVQFCLWLWVRSVWHQDRVELLVQECFLDFVKHSWRQNAAAFVHRIMTIILLLAAHRVWGAMPCYEDVLRRYALGRHFRFDWLPVPSNVEVVQDSIEVAAVRKRFAARGFLIGHFGTYGRNITELLELVVPELLRNVDSTLLLLGAGSQDFRERLCRLCPDLAARIHATGYQDDPTLSAHLSACDVMIQPYPDGVTARRGSTLAPMAHGRPVVTNATARTELLWKETGAVILAPMTSAGFLHAVIALKEDARERSRAGTAARETYLQYFEPARMLNALRSSEATSCASSSLPRTATSWVASKNIFRR